MKFVVILTILAMPICAQATVCDQYLQISEQVSNSRAAAHAEWKDRPLWLKIADWVGGLQKPEGVLILPAEKVTKELASHYDRVIKLDGDNLRLERYYSEARDAFEKHAKFETTKLERLLRISEFLMHLMPSSARPSYLTGRIIQSDETGFDFLDYPTRTLYRVENEEFVGAKSVDLGNLGGEKLKPALNDSRSVWQAGSGRDLIEFLKDKVDGAANFVLQVADGSNYGIPGFHQIPLPQLARVQFVERGIFIPDLRITVPADKVVVVSRP